MEEKRKMPVVIRREIIAGQHGIVFVHHGGGICVDSGLHTPKELREAAHILNQIAEYLEGEK